ncbi:MAG TPA: ribosomal L7Ae/L30e/S12e/Gadd45 family protein [Conexivisphaerales archaeon]|nr:ribosomal L7Ae/L30e/S12e/Gadd45 family protein [Conexivisphaerales archaeon]
MESKIVGSVVKTAMKTGKVVLGEKASLRALKSSKMVVVSQSLTGEEVESVTSACKEADVPLVVFEGSAVALGALMGRSFPVKVLSVKSAGDADLRKLLGSGTPEAVPEQKA